MIVGNSAWESKLAAKQKQPLYCLVLDDFGVHILSFIPADVNVSTTGGYGTAYGTAYGND